MMTPSTLPPSEPAAPLAGRTWIRQATGEEVDDLRAADLALAALEGAGFRFEVVGDRLRVSPSSRLPTADRELIAALKPQLLALLEGRTG